MPKIAVIVIGAGFAIWAYVWWHTITHPDPCEKFSPEPPDAPYSPGVPRNFPPYQPPPAPRVPPTSVR